MDYARLNNTFPNESTATSIVTLGTIERAATEFEVPGAYHLVFLKSLIPSQVSSQLIITLSLKSYKNLIAHLYLNTRLLSLLPCIGI